MDDKEADQNLNENLTALVYGELRGLMTSDNATNCMRTGSRCFTSLRYSELQIDEATDLVGGSPPTADTP